MSPYITGVGVCFLTLGERRTWRIGTVLTASPVMHASRVRTPLIMRWVFREISLFFPDHVNGGLAEVRLKPVYRRYFRAGWRLTFYLREWEVVERLITSPVMQASWVRNPLILLGSFREIYCFSVSI